MSQDAARARDLLFALHGLQTGLIEKDDLLAAIEQWKPENQSSLRDILLTQAALAADACGVIDSVVVHHVQKHGGLDRSLERVAARVAAGVGDALSTLLPSPAGAGGRTEMTAGEGASAGCRESAPEGPDGGTVWLTPAEVPGDVLRFAPREGTAAPPRFTVLRPHARGGLGAVHVALDRELKREVALKQIQERHADEPASRARFVFEAEVTGALEHPGIVPVYSLGADVIGRPYYVMRFIKGDSLQEAIAKFHGEPGRVSAGSQFHVDPGRVSTESQFHGEPGRVSAGSEFHGEPGRASAGSEFHGEPGRVSAGSRSKSRSETRSAKTRGVNASPLAFRQLLRRFIDVCNAIDYAHSRGVLHRDLKPANIIVGHHGETLVVDWGLAKAVGRSDPTRARGECVILPSSGSGSAETIEGSALGTPSFMSPEQASGQLDRLGPASDVYSLGATLYCLLTGTPPFMGENVREVLARAQNGDFVPPCRVDRSIPPTLEAVVLKAMARDPKERYSTARTLADDIERWMADEPTSARRERLDERARRWMRRRRASVMAAAAALLASLVGLVAVVVVQSRANAALHSANSQLSASNQRERDANASLQTANQKLAASNERERERFALALTAIKTFHTGVSEDVLLKEKAFEGLRKKLLHGAADFYGKLEALLRNQADRSSRSALSEAYAELAELMQEIGSQERALALYRQSLELRQTLAAEPDSPSSEKLDVVRGMLDTGRAHQRIGELGPARAAFEESLKLAGRLPNDLDSKRAQAVLARCYWNLASVEIDASRPDLAIAADTNARTIQQKLVDEFPGDLQLKVDLVNTDLSTGYNLIAHMGKPADALVYLEHAREIQERVVAGEPEDPHYLRVLSECSSLIGLVHLELGRPQSALDALGRAHVLQRKLVEKNPNVTMYQNFLAGDLGNIGIAYAKAGDRQKSLGAYSASRRILEKLTAADPSAVKLQRDLASTINNIGDAELGLGRVSPALEAFSQARKLLEALVKAHPSAQPYQQGLAFSLSGQGRANLRRGETATGVADLRASSAIWERLTISTNESLYALAGNHALIAAAAGVPGSGVSASEAETEAKRAVERLRKPLTARYHTTTELRADPDFRAILGRPDFENMLLDLQFPVDPFAGH
ncbi:MAG: protein kinase domain-containing protein [Isosphaeraceae bacterium]